VTRLSFLASTAIAAASLCVAEARAQTLLTLDGQTSTLRELGETVDIAISGAAFQPTALMLDADAGPTNILGLTVPLGLTGAFAITVIGITDGNGDLSAALPIPHAPALHGQTYYLAALLTDAGAPSGLTVSNGADLTIVARPQLAGNTLAEFPHFEHVTAFNRQSSVELGVDPRYVFVQGKTADIYVVASRTKAEWDLNTALVDVRGGPQTETFPAAATTIQQNTFVIDTGMLPGPDEAPLSGDTSIGVGYDVVIDFDQDGQFTDGVDLIDGYDDEQAGFYVCRNLTLGGTLGQPGAGPFGVTEITYSGGTMLQQNTYYPTNIASMGQLPLVVVSHGNGHNYQWYNHLGYHLASYGYVVMSHSNNTVPGSHTAAETTLTNTDYIIGNQAAINGGVLNGHLDTSRITWIGHSRGADGVARAYDRLFQGTYTPTNFTIDDIALVSSIAPVDFGGYEGQGAVLGGNGNGSHPHDANFHLWVAAADADVHGCADNEVVFWYGLHERATRKRQSICLYGVGHGDYHDGGGSSVASGPALIGRANTHNIMRGYVLALISHHIQGDVPSRDYLWRQYESFRPVGAPTGPNVTANMMFQDDAESGKFVIDDFQDQAYTSPNLATSGATVEVDVTAFVEGRQDDSNTNFSDMITDPFNGFLFDHFEGTGPWRTNSYGCVFEFNGSDQTIRYDLLNADDPPDLNDFAYLSFRAAQGTRHPLTTAVLGDLTFSVALEDAFGNSSSINIGAYGGGIEEPYQRNTGPGCGSGLGWNTEYETIRIRLTDFLNNGSDIDLANVRFLTFAFGPSHGSTQGRLGLDEIELTVN